MPFQLPELPYPVDALEPHMSARTLEFHHGQHHRSYVEKLNAAIEKSPLEGKSLEEVIQATAEDKGQADIFNNAAQVWNHSFFWPCMTPNAGSTPSSELAERLTDAFGSFAYFKMRFCEAAGGQFGSGWIWLFLNGDDLQIASMPDAETPIMHGFKPLLTCDLWEHAFYLDYQNRKDDFVSTYLDVLVDWDFVASRLTTDG